MPNVPYVQRIRRSDGRVDLWFRKGHVRRKLHSADDTDDLAKEVQEILSSISALEEHRRPLAGTIASALRDYQRSADFTALARSTRQEYSRVAEHISEDCGEVRLSDVTSSFVRDLRDAWAASGHRAANVNLQVLKNALEPAVEDGRVDQDPFARLRKVKRPHELGETNPTWEDAEVAAVIDSALANGHPGFARAVALARFGGFRRGTICALPLNSRVVGRGGERRIQHVTEKKKVRADKREDPRLTALLAATPNRATTIAYNAGGRPWVGRQLSQALDRALSRLAEGGKVRGAKDPTGRWRSPLTLHGLRHARGVELALAGASDAEIMAQLEHATDRAAKIYRRQADRRKLSDAGQDRVDAVVDLAAKKRTPASSS